ncbi:MAG: precorrin-2 C(20)-methyltransferase, partial [Ferrovum sp.]|nr:precorrin-2 C(20)-methyltransferase [Ferrovum sp.]
MSTLGKFFGIGVGPGPAGLIPVAALAALRQADIIYLPRARASDISIARQCLAGLDLPEDRLREIEFNMDSSLSALGEYYGLLAQKIAMELREGLDVAYLTLGDSMTYSTCGYLLAALRDIEPALDQRIFPGITSFAATASAFGWPLGEGKERALILPCPETMEALRADILNHDIVVLMKIGKRLAAVLVLLREMGIQQY